MSFPWMRGRVSNQRISRCCHSMSSAKQKLVAPRGIRTHDTRFKVWGANHYTMGARENDEKKYNKYSGKIFSINHCISQSACTPPQMCAVRHPEVRLEAGHSNWNSDVAIPCFNAAKPRSRLKYESFLSKLHLSASIRVFQLFFTKFQFQKFTHACF